MLPKLKWSTYPVTLIILLLGSQTGTLMSGSKKQWNFSRECCERGCLSHWHASWEHVGWFSHLATTVAQENTGASEVMLVNLRIKPKQGQEELSDEEKLSPNYNWATSPTILDVFEIDKCIWTGKASFAIFCHLPFQGIILG